MAGFKIFNGILLRKATRMLDLNIYFFCFIGYSLEV